MTITILDIIHRPVFYLKHNVSEDGFCSRFQVEATQLGTIDRPSLCLRFLQKTETSFDGWAKLSRFHLKTETVSSLRNLLFSIEDKSMDNVRNCGSYRGKYAKIAQSDIIA
jgi:hypothetical protein